LSKVIRVKYEKGVLKPLEPLKMRDGEEAIVVIKEKRLSELARSLRREARIDIDSLMKEVRGRGKALHD